MIFQQGECFCRPRIGTLPMTSGRQWPVNNCSLRESAPRLVRPAQSWGPIRPHCVHGYAAVDEGAVFSQGDWWGPPSWILKNWKFLILKSIFVADIRWLDRPTGGNYSSHHYSYMPPTTGFSKGRSTESLNFDWVGGNVPSHVEWPFRWLRWALSWSCRKMKICLSCHNDFDFCTGSQWWGHATNWPMSPSESKSISD